MKRIALIVVIFSVLVGAAYAGPEQYSGKEMKQVAVPPCPEWYADREFNLSIWGTYVFSNHNNERQSADDFDDAELGLNDGASFVDLSRENSGDRYLETSHAWGGGIDFKYFCHRYFGVGVEGFLLDARRTRTDITIDDTGQVFFHRLDRSEDRRAVGGALGTFTLRYPFHCSRFAPYAFAGAGAMFNGGERDLLVSNVAQDFASTDHQGSTTKAVGQFGGGLEVRFTRHIGLTSDFSWNVIDGPRNNFGMVRSGLNFAF